MNQTVTRFASAAARTSALVFPYPSEGQVSYLEDTNALEIYNGTNWVAASNAVSAGSTLISSTTFTSVSSVSVNNVFTSLYDTYKVVLYAAAAGGVKMFMRLSGTDSAAGYYDNKIVTSGAGGATITGSFQNNVATGWMPFVQSGQNTIVSGSVTLINPAIASSTQYSSTPTWYSNSGGNNGMQVGSAGYHGAATAYDGFTFTLANSTTGYIQVYGQKD
jgi:hypothetical protein